MKLMKNNKNSFIHSIHYLSLFLLLFLISNLVNSNPLNNISIGSTASVNYESNALDTEIGFKLLFDEIMVKRNEESNIKVYKNFDLLWEDYSEGKIDICIATTLEMISNFHEFYANGFLALVADESPFTEYILLVKNNTYRSLDELKNKSLAMTHHLDIGNMYLDVELMEHSLPQHNEYFSEVVNEGNSHTAIVNLLFGKIDAVLISKSGFRAAMMLNPNIQDDVTVLLESEKLLTSIIALRKDIDKGQADKISQTATTLHETPKGKHLLKMFRNEKIIAVDSHHLQSVRDLRSRYDVLRSAL